MGDLANGQVANVIDIGKDGIAAYSPPSANLLFTGVQSDSGTAMFPTVYFDGTVAGQGLIVLVTSDLPWISNNGPGNTYFNLGSNIGGVTGDQPSGWNGSSSGSSGDFSVTGAISGNTAQNTVEITELVGSATDGAIYAGANAGARTNANYSIDFGQNSTYLNAPGAGAAGLLVQRVPWFRAFLTDQESLACNASTKPIVGDSSQSSPYGVHGYQPQAMGAGGTIIAASSVYKNGIIKLTGNPGGAAVLQLPLGVYAKLIDNQTAGGFTITVQGPTGSGVAISATGKVWVYCDGANFN